MTTYDKKATDEVVVKLREQLESIIKEIDHYSADPSSLDYEGKTIFAFLYSYASDYYKKLDREVGIEKETNNISYYYENAIQELGAILWKSISQNTDYVVINKNPEGTVGDSTLHLAIWEKYKSSYADYCDFNTNFKIEDYLSDVYEVYVQEYSELLETIKKASDRRSKKKKNPLPPVYIIWEDQMYDYLLGQDAFNKDLIKCIKRSDQSGITDCIARAEPFVENGKDAEFSIVLKKGTKEEGNEAIRLLQFAASNFEKIAKYDSEPVIDGNTVKLLMRSAKADKENYMNEFINEDPNNKLERAVKMFTTAVEAIEKEMDSTGDYSDPTAVVLNFEGKCIVEPEKSNNVSEFLGSIKTWMNTHDLNYDHYFTPEQITDSILKYFNEAISCTRDWINADIDGVIGVRIVIGLAVAYLNYATPFADIEIMFVHDKWEYRGDYDSDHRIGFVINQSTDGSFFFGITEYD